jgi:hypothetical protein
MRTTAAVLAFVVVSGVVGFPGSVMAQNGNAQKSPAQQVVVLAVQGMT